MTEQSETNANKLDMLANLDKSNNIDQPIEPTNGWIDIDREKISYLGALYKRSLRFQIKPASIGTVKYFSTLDENNPLSVNDALTFVIQNHIRVLDGARSIPPLEVIFEHDRFFFVMLVHTYSGAPTALTYEAKCTHEKCNCLQEISISPYNIRYSELSDKAKGYIHAESGEFRTTTKTLGDIRYRPLTLLESGELTEFMLKSRRNGEEIEPLFLQIAPFLVCTKKPEDTASHIYQSYLKLTSNLKMVSVLIHFLREANVAQLLEIEIDCKKCKRPFRSQISSVKGLRNIFLVDDIDGELS